MPAVAGFERRCGPRARPGGSKSPVARGWSDGICFVAALLATTRAAAPVVKPEPATVRRTPGAVKPPPHGLAAAGRRHDPVGLLSRRHSRPSLFLLLHRTSHQIEGQSSPQSRPPVAPRLARPRAKRVSSPHNKPI